MPSKSIHVAANHKVLGFLWLSSIPSCVCVCVCVCVCTCHIFSIHSSVDRHLGCFHNFTIINNAAIGKYLQDGRGVRSGDHLPPHKYIRNTSTCGTTPTEHLLNAGRRPQTSQKARNYQRTWVGQKKKQRQKNRDRTGTSGREL